MSDDGNRISGRGPATETEFERQVVATLERSLDRLAPAVLARLAEARRDALHRRPRRLLFGVGGLALAAGIAALAVVPWLHHRAPSQSPLIDAGYLAVDPQMLADMDMLEAIGAGSMRIDRGGA